MCALSVGWWCVRRKLAVDVLVGMFVELRVWLLCVCNLQCPRRVIEKLGWHYQQVRVFFADTKLYDHFTRCHKFAPVHGASETCV